MPRAKQRTPELRQHLLGVAVEMLRHDSVAAFTVREVASKAGTSPPAVYELFGDKPGLLREVFFEGFRLLRSEFDKLEHDEDEHPRDAVVDMIACLRAFVRDNPVLADLMFSRPFADFHPGPDERSAGDAVREFIVGRVQRTMDVERLRGDATDIAHILLALALGLAASESASRLGTTQVSINRRWFLGVNAVLDGLKPQRAPRRRSKG